MTEFFGNKTAAIILFIYLPAAFTLIVTYLNHRNFLKKRNDYGPRQNPVALEQAAWFAASSGAAAVRPPQRS